MKGLFLRFIIVAITVIGVIWLIPGLAVEKLRWALLFVCLVALFNAILKQALIKISLGCSVLALGPILLIANTMALWLANFLGKWFPQPIEVANFWAALWGGLVISVVSFMMTMLVSND
jgi:putative membrane protein